MKQPLGSNQHSLSRQLLTRVGVTLLIIGFIILCLNYFWKIADFKQQIRNQAQSITDSLEFIKAEIIQPENPDNLAQFMQKLGSLPAVVQVAIVTPKGHILASSFPNLVQQEDYFWSSYMPARLEKSTQTQVAISFSGKIQNQPVFVYISPLKSQVTPLRKKPEIAIAILDLQPLQQQAWRTFLSSILLLLVGCLIILVLIGLLLRQTVLTPLNQLYQSLRQYQKDTFLEVPELLDSNEIGFLAKAIYQQFIDLKQINAQLKIEVAEREKAEKKIQASLQEKELLLREIHHRVKNNLFIVSQILEFQSNYLENVQLIHILKECQDRIYSMALIHETLYRTTDLEKINFADYLESLVYYLNESYNSNLNQSIEIKLELKPIILNVETANPCGLIVSELISNAFKHAFKTEKNGIIKVVLNQDDLNKIHLKIQDNGVGFPENLDFQQVDSLGLELVRTLTQQLRGHLELDRRDGTTFKLTFAELDYNKRW